jgi:hypothetical protein
MPSGGLRAEMANSQALAADAWGVDRSTVADIFDPMDKWLKEQAPTMTTERYPFMWKNNDRWLGRLVREILLSVSPRYPFRSCIRKLTLQEELCREYASYFKGKTTEELDELAKSFSLSECSFIIFGMILS